MAKKRRRKQHKRTMYKLLMATIATAVMVVLLIGALLLQEQQTDSESDPGAEIVPVGATTISTTGSAATTTTTTTTTTTGTTTTTTTRTNTGPTLLQYGTEGHYVQPDNAAWNLLLVNDWNKLPAGYDDGVTFVAGGNRNQRVDGRIIADLNAMLQAGAAYGIDVQSGYRPESHQSSLYWRKVEEYMSYGYDDVAAQQAAGAVVKRPGHSEHNCGLAVDLGGSGNFSLETDFANTEAYTWLIQHCAEYGFILRFPQGKEAITGVIYEPWHYRYVGREAAQYIMENGLCLEEYLEQTEQ